MSLLHNNTSEPTLSITWFLLLLHVLYRSRKKKKVRDEILYKHSAICYVKRAKRVTFKIIWFFSKDFRLKSLSLGKISPCWDNGSFISFLYIFAFLSTSSNCKQQLSFSFVPSSLQVYHSIINNYHHPLFSQSPLKIWYNFPSSIQIPCSFSLDWFALLDLQVKFSCNLVRFDPFSLRVYFGWRIMKNWGGIFILGLFNGGGRTDRA